MEAGSVLVPLFLYTSFLVLESFLLRFVMASAEIEFRCFVGGLAWATDDQSLERAFSQYGEILESKVRFRPSQRSDLTRFGFVDP